jgi:predicted peroxiredoxin
MRVRRTVWTCVDRIPFGIAGFRSSPAESLMAQYLLIQSRDPFERHDVAVDFEMATSLVTNGDEVTLFLVQNGVLPARSGAITAALDGVVAAGIEILADDFSLRERGIAPADLADGVRPAAIDEVVDALAAGTKTIWL